MHHLVRILGRLAFEDAFERRGKAACGLVAVIGFLGKRTRHDTVDLGRHLHDRGRLHGVVLHDLLRKRPLGSLERLQAGQELVEDDAGRKNVGPVIDGLPLDLFRRHIGRRTDHRAGLRGLALLRLRVDHARHAEIGELRMPLDVDHDVGRLDVAVDDPGFVGEIQRPKQFRHEPERSRDIESLARVKPVLEFLAVDVLHHDVGHVAFGTEVVDLHDIAMVEARDRAHFALEALRVHLRHFLVELLDENGLDRDAAVQPRIAPVIDQPHRALAEHAFDLVPAERLG